MITIYAGAGYPSLVGTAKSKGDYTLSISLNGHAVAIKLDNDQMKGLIGDMVASL